MKKVLVTGASGFIGKYLLKELELEHAEYLAVDVKAIDGVPKDMQEQVSLLERERVNDVIKRYNPDVVIHLAAIASVTHENVGEIYNVNVCGTDNLLTALQENQKAKTRVILISTAGVYGNQNVDEYDESLPFNPANHYSYSKMVTEYLSRQFKEDLDIVIVRPFNIIGAGQSEKFLIPKLVKHFADRSPKILVGNISSFRDYVDVEYCARILTKLALTEKVEFNTLNICSGTPCSGEMVIHLLEEITGFKPVVEVSSEFVRKNEVWKMIGNPKRVLIFMDGDKGKELKEILVDMLDYYKHIN